jgi:Domain of unknown function (DUF222)
MHQEPAPSSPGRDGDPLLVPSWPAWMDDPAYLACRTDDEDPGDLEEDEDPDNAPPGGLDDCELDALLAEARASGPALAADQAAVAEAWARSGHTAVIAAVAAVVAGRRGPGMPGSAESYPAEHASPAAGFAAGMPLDTAPGCVGLGAFLDEAAGDDDRYAGVTDEELAGVICGWDRFEAHASARKHAAVAELIRRRPGPGGWDEFTGRELGAILGIAFTDAEDLLSLADALQTRLPGTRALFRSGILSQAKAAIIASATMLLDPEEARAAEALVLGRAGSLTPAGLRAAIRRAVMEVAPGQARQRREHAAKQARVERWAEGSGNAGLAGRELPPAEVLAADQRVTAWAKELRKAGVAGGMDRLRARAYLDLLLGTDSRPLGSAPDRPDQDAQSRCGGPGEADGPDEGSGRPHNPGPGGSEPAEPRIPVPAGPVAGVIPPGFAGRVTMTITLPTLLDLADRPGELAGLWPVDPGLARDLAAAAACNPRSTWCLTVTDSQGHAIGHGCARPAPATSHTTRHKPDTSCGPDPPRGPRFSFTPTGDPGPPGGYGTWRFSTGIPGQRDWLIKIGPLPVGECDHRHEAKGHDPGVMLRHLAQVRHATCTGPGCRRPASRADFEHNTPYEAGGRTCLCNGNPKCRFDHRLKQDPRWQVEQLGNGNVRWTTPSGRQYTTEPTRYLI